MDVVADTDTDMTHITSDAASEGVAPTCSDTPATGIADRLTAAQTLEFKAFFQNVCQQDALLRQSLSLFHVCAEGILEIHGIDRWSGETREHIDGYGARLHTFLGRFVRVVRQARLRHYLPAWLEPSLVPPSPTARVCLKGKAYLCQQAIDCLTRVDCSTQEQLIVHLLQSCVDVQDERSPDRDAVPRDFQAAFRGSGDEYLAEHIRIMRTIYNDRKHHGCIVPVVQSSGSGKSRTVDQLMRTSQLGLTVCVRTAGDNAAWPPRDEAVASLFERRTVDRDPRRMRGLAWLEAFAHESADEVERLAAVPESRPAGLAHDFHRHLHGPQDVASPTCGSSRPDHVGVSHSSIRNRPMLRRDVLLQKIRKRCDGTLTRFDDGIKEGDLMRYRDNDCTEAFKRLQSVVTSAISAKRLAADACFVLAVDEASNLDDDLQILCDTWYAMGHACGAWADRLVLVLLGTDFSLNTPLAVPPTSYGSTLVRIYHPPLPPFAALPHDVGWDHLSGGERKAHGKKWSQLLQHLRLMGRPLWNNEQLLFGVQDTRLELPTVGGVSLRKVQVKLLSTETPQLPDLDLHGQAVLPTDPNHSKAIDMYFAVLGQRLSLKLVDWQVQDAATKSFVQRQVGLHLRTLQMCDTPPSWAVTGTPSEPLLSIAAADLFRQQRKELQSVEARWRMGVRALVVFRYIYGLAAGEDRGVVARLLLTMATDLASTDSVDRKARHQHAADKRVLWRQGHTTFPVDAWSVINVLLGTDRLAVALEPYGGSLTDVPTSHKTGRGQEGSGRSFETFARLARVSFTHFSWLSEGIRETSKSELAGLFAAHVALIGKHHQRDWDLLIPIYIDDDWNGDETIIDEEKCSFILVQVQNETDQTVATRVPPPTVSSRGPDVDTGERRFEYISLFLQPYAPTGREGSPVSYLCDTFEGHREHRLTAVDLEEGFGMVHRLERCAPGAIDDIFALLGRPRTRAARDLDTARNGRMVSLMQTSRYLRSHD